MPYFLKETEESGFQIADALDAHNKYVQSLESWHRWQNEKLEEFGPTNGELLILWSKINEYLERSRQNDQNVDDLRLSLRLNYGFFEYEIKKKIGDIEQKALSLITHLESEEFLRQLDQYPLELQIVYQNILLDRLAESSTGLVFLKENSLTTPPRLSWDSQFLPICHTERINSIPGDVQEWIGTSSWLAGQIAELVTKILPGVFSKCVEQKNCVYMIDFTILFVKRFYVPPQGVVYEQIVEVEAVQRVLKELRLYARENDKLSRIGQAFGYGAVALELFNAYFLFWKLKDDPNWRTTGNFAGSLVGLTEGLSKAAAALEIQFAKKLSESLTVKLLGGFATAWTVGTSFWDAGAALYEDDTSVAMGKLLHAVGVLQLTAALALSVAWPLTLAFIAIAAIGEIIALTTVDSPIEKWFLKNYFGKLWIDVEGTAAPDKMEFLWKHHHSGSPRDNVARQLVEFYSIRSGIVLEKAKFASNNQTLTIRIKPPVWGFLGPELIIKPLDQKGKIITEYIIHLETDINSVSPHLPPTIGDRPNWLNDVNLDTYNPTKPLGWWECVINTLVGDLPLLADPVFVEVDVVLAGRIHKDTSQHDIITGEGFTENIPSLLRVRKRLEIT